MGCYIWYQSILLLEWPEGSGFIEFLLRVDFWNLVSRNRQNVSSWMFDHDIWNYDYIWVILIVMKLLRKKNNLDKVMRVHIHDLIKIDF